MTEPASPPVERRLSESVRFCCHSLLNDLALIRHQALSRRKILQLRKRRFALAVALVWAAGVWLRE